MLKKFRNPITASPLLKKGGVHVKAKSSQRHQVKRNIKKEVLEWSKNQHYF
ncbi:MAG: hypothetical protein KAH84_05005 [Thiomargarita sp.]|nr:hypothetical protein [Thiomargarita sp.]